MNVLRFFAAVILLGWFDVAGLIELMGVVKWVSGTKFCSSLLTGTSGDSWIVASCWEADDTSFEFEGTWRNSLLHGDEQSMPFWFLLANACKDSSALPKFSWCWTCWRIHLDNPKGEGGGGGEKKKVLPQNYIVYTIYWCEIASKYCKYICICTAYTDSSISSKIMYDLLSGLGTWFNEWHY